MSSSIQSLIVRKSIHLATVILPFLYLYLFTREQMLALCCILSIGFLTVDLSRYRYQKLQSIFLGIFGSLLKENEKNRKLTGATHLLISATIIILLFSKDSVIPALFIMSIADAGAAVAGTIFGTHSLFKKTWEGSAVFFLVSFFIIIVFTALTVEVVILISALLAIIEVMPIPVNDNYSVAMGSAIAFSLLIS